MDIMELGAIGELVGGAAVLVTLAYLAIQVRQGNQIARNNASQQWTGFNFTLTGDIVNNRSLAEAWVQAGTEFDELDAVDQQRLTMFEWRAIELWHHAFHQRRTGVLADYQWSKVLAIMKGSIGQRQSVREAWKTFREGYDKDFRDLLDRLLET